MKSVNTELAMTSMTSLLTAMCAKRCNRFHAFVELCKSIAASGLLCESLIR